MAEDKCLEPSDMTGKDQFLEYEAENKEKKELRQKCIMKLEKHIDDEPEEWEAITEDSLDNLDEIEDMSNAEVMSGTALDFEAQEKEKALKKTYAEAVKGIQEDPVWGSLSEAGESVIKAKYIGFPYKDLNARPATSTPLKSPIPKMRKRTKRILPVSTQKSEPVIVITSDEDESPLKKIKHSSNIKIQRNGNTSSPIIERGLLHTGSPMSSDSSPEEAIIDCDLTDAEKNTTKRKLFNESDSDSLPSLDYSPKRNKRCYNENKKKGVEYLSEDNQHEEFTSFYENDPLLPVYKKMAVGISTKEAVEVLVRDLPSDCLAGTVPLSIEDNISLVYSINKIGHWKNALADGMGRWNQSGTDTFYADISDINNVTLTSEPGLSEYYVKVQRRKYTNSSYNKLHRIVIILLHPDDEKVLDHTFVQYYFQGPVKQVKINPHGNCKEKDQQYKRTSETTKTRIEQLCHQKSKPKDIYHTVLEEQGGINYVKSGAAIPRDRQQIRNIKKNAKPQIEDPLVELIELAKLQENRPDRFLRKVSSSPEFTAFLATERQLKDIEKFCTFDEFPSILGVDTTFNIGKFYVTVTTYRHLMLHTADTKSIEPVMIGPILIHQKKTFDSYFMLPSSMLQENPALKNIKVFGTDGDVNLSNAFEVCFPFAAHLLCDLHMTDNIERKLRNLGITGQIAKDYNNDIFGYTSGNVKVQGLVDCLSEEEFDNKLDLLTPQWESRHSKGHDFIHYFKEYKADLIKKCMSAEIRSKCGLGFPPKPYNQNPNECLNSVLKSDLFTDESSNRKLDPFECVKRLQKIVKRQEEEIKLALISKGEYRLKTEFQSLCLEENLFYRKTAPQREALFKRFQQTPVIKGLSEDLCDDSGLSITAGEIKNIPGRILQDILDKANNHAKTKSDISRMPGNTNMLLVVNPQNQNIPFVVKYSPTTKNISCSNKCVRWNSFQLCEHSLAVALHLDIGQTYLQSYKKRKSKPHDVCNLTEMVNTNLPQNRGSKPKKATQIRKGKANKTVQQVEQYQEPQLVDTDQQNVDNDFQPFHLTFLQGLIKKCYGCGQEFLEKHRKPPKDLILKRFDYRVYKSPRTQTLCKTKSLQNTYFHLNLECPRRVSPYFEVDSIIIHNEIRSQLTEQHIRVLKNFGMKDP